MWPGYHMFFRKQCWHLVKWVNFGYDEYTKISLVWSQLIFISSCFEACGVQRFHLQKVCARDWFCIMPIMKKSTALFHIKNFSSHVTLATFKRKLQHVGHKWVTSRLFFGSDGSTGATHFQPCEFTNLVIYKISTL